VLRAAAVAAPGADALLFSGGRLLPAVFRNGRRVARGALVRDGDRLDLVLSNRRRLKLIRAASSGAALHSLSSAPAPEPTPVDLHIDPQDRRPRRRPAQTSILPGLQERYRDCRISWVTAPAAVDLLRHNPRIAEIISLEAGSRATMEPVTERLRLTHVGPAAVLRTTRSPCAGSPRT
jgi:hypothetical protein